MKYPPLHDQEGKWVTDMGAWFAGERVVFRGKDLFNELQDMSWMGLLLYGITGREFNNKQIQLFDGIWKICTSYPDPRIWNNRVGALAGTARSTAALALHAANAVSDAKIYGGRAEIRAIDFLYRVQDKLKKGANLNDIIAIELKEHRTIAGYGRPVTRQDERIKPLMRLAEELGAADGDYVQLAFSVETALLENRWRMHMNIAAVSAGLAADQGLSASEFYQYLLLSFSTGILCCYIDASNKEVGSLFPMACNKIKYTGQQQPRKW